MAYSEVGLVILLSLTATHFRVAVQLRQSFALVTVFVLLRYL